MCSKDIFRGAVLLGVMFPHIAHARTLSALGAFASGQQQANTVCDLCADNWLLILAPGKASISTTALSMFNTIPGFEIGGEHKGLLVGDAVIFGLLNETLHMGGRAWQGNGMDFHSLQCNVQEFMKLLIFGAQHDVSSYKPPVLGFMEGHYANWPMLRFIGQVFPCARYVFLAPSTGADSEKVQLLQEVAEHFPKTTSLITGDSAGEYNAVLRNLGVQDCSFSSVPHESSNGTSMVGSETNSEGLLAGSCNLSDLDFRLKQSQLDRHEEIWMSLAGDVSLLATS